MQTAEVLQHRGHLVSAAAEELIAGVGAELLAHEGCIPVGALRGLHLLKVDTIQFSTEYRKGRIHVYQIEICRLLSL